MKLVIKPSCFGSVDVYDNNSIDFCWGCLFMNECVKEAERAEEEYRFLHGFP